jgi:hypothetical protein
VQVDYGRMLALGHGSKLLAGARYTNRKVPARLITSSTNNTGRDNGKQKSGRGKGPVDHDEHQVPGGGA